jgi:hypothetical protein
MPFPFPIASIPICLPAAGEAARRGARPGSEKQNSGAAGDQKARANPVQIRHFGGNVPNYLQTGARRIRTGP